METLLWTVLGLFLLNLWLKGHWFGWVIAWPAIMFLWTGLTPMPDPGSGFRWPVLFFSGAIAGAPMAVRSMLYLAASRG